MTTNKSHNKEKGDTGEDLAVDYLSGKGYAVVHRNWRYGRYELDLIVQNTSHIVFVEVKTRYSSAYSEPWEAVHKNKRLKIMRSADHYLREIGSNREPRFDIISIIITGAKSSIQHIESAFWPSQQ